MRTIELTDTECSLAVEGLKLAIHDVHNQAAQAETPEDVEDFQDAIRCLDLIARKIAGAE